MTKVNYTVARALARSEPRAVLVTGEDGKPGAALRQVNVLHLELLPDGPDGSAGPVQIVIDDPDKATLEHLEKGHPWTATFAPDRDPARHKAWAERRDEIAARAEEKAKATLAEEAERLAKAKA